MKDKTSSYILSLHTSPNSSSEDNKLISQLILNTSLIGEKLLIMEGFFSIYKLGKSVYTTISCSKTRCLLISIR